MARLALSQQDRKRIDRAVEHFNESRHLFETFAQGLMLCFQSSPELARHIHFIKYRIKDVEHLRKKLARKRLEAKAHKRQELIDESNLFQEVNDLAGIRIIHLHTDQLRYIHNAILGILDEQQYRLVEKPTANCWDREYENLFKGFGIGTCSRDSMYTTVHYVIRANQRTAVTCELQVRTLMDEVWGEVSHRVNYPAESPSEVCKDQLKVLARLTTGCTRLVDSIFKSHVEAVQEE